MKIIARLDYNDTFEKKMIKKGETYETSDERAKLIVSRGFAEFVKAEPAKVEKQETEVDAPKEDTKVEAKKESKKRRR